MKCRDLQPEKQDANNNPKKTNIFNKITPLLSKNCLLNEQQKAVPCCGHNMLIYTNLQFQNDQREQLPIHRLPNSEERQTEEGLLSNQARDSTSVTKVRFCMLERSWLCKDELYTPPYIRTTDTNFGWYSEENSFQPSKSQAAQTGLHCVLLVLHL